jgi:tRNA (guanine-N7-)-methyltransferase
MTEQPALPTPRLFGRRLGRPLRVRKTALLETLLPSLQLALPSHGFAKPQAWFATPPQALWLEIGFGGGEHLAAQAAQHPNIGFIGCEPFRNGVASLLDHIDRRTLTNIRIHPDDARQLLAALPPASLARAFLLFADPWPKKRHAERRFVQQTTLQELARVMQTGALLRLATDDPVLQEWTTEQMRATSFFVPEFGDGISAQRPADWVITRYEEKALLAGRTPLYYCFRKG